MVIFGGLEIVAAGYVLHELGKDGEKARNQRDHRRRRNGSHSHSHSHHRRDSDSRPNRPNRPSQSGLAPPIMAPPRPNSAPPQQVFAQGYSQGPGPGSGPWMNQQLQQQQQRPPPHPLPLPAQQHSAMQGPLPPQSWSHPPGPRPMYLAGEYPQDPRLQQQPQRPTPGPSAQPPQFQSPPAPGNLVHQPTMHFDMKTGKWQSSMLPPEMLRAGSVPAPLTRGDPNFPTTASSGLRHERRNSSPPPTYRSNSSSSSDSFDEDLAYGKLSGERRQGSWHGRRRPSVERRRPVGNNWGPGGSGPMAAELQGSGNQGGVGPGRVHGAYGSMPVEMAHQMRFELP